MKIWIHGRDDRDIRFMLAHCVNAGDDIAGFSNRQDVPVAFPQEKRQYPMVCGVCVEIVRALGTGTPGSAEFF